MPVAWPDEFYADYDDNEWDGEANGPDHSEIDADSEAVWCAGLLPWMRATEVPHPRRESETELGRLWFGLPESNLVACTWWSEPSRTHARRIWDVLAAIDSAVAQLDASPLPPERETELVARSLETLAQRLIRLERALPTPDDSSSLYEPEESKRAVHVDWQRINRDQAAGLPRGLLSEDGVELAHMSRIKVFDVYAVESDAEEPLFE